MAIAIGDEHQELARTTRALLASRNARAAGRALLEAPHEALPDFWKEFADLGLLGLHLPTEYGGGGAGLPELVVVVEELGRALAPGPFVPTVAASAIVDACGGPRLRGRLLPGLANGDTVAAFGLLGDLTLTDGRLFGDGGVVLGGGAATLFVLAVGDDMVVVPPT
ncbi:Acyl-CoA dehydrogenase, N-terminal domain [Parafrankia irregularis]|uniref:Acyl-CoA dehydrogenase, N-terminal domain n=1 Tax=Parafrankia irregularis TaxID=795642 RepID=A0A0S4QWZ5_9ACTN|nr:MULTISPECIES: acyl-CoA dehydrogenase family protein [Parafrankia]CUU59288.1 Acyl-CoA dehydrogenase, N-terminal domain [Parafrankia irregularis]